MKKSWEIVLILSANAICANIGPEGFGQFANYYFIETGTYMGNGIRKAMASGAFKEFRSIEAHKDLFNQNRRRFAQRADVRIWHGDSAAHLWDMIKDISMPATFWLDAHVYPPRSDGGKNCPLMEELDQIKRHHIKSHTILIDDMHCVGTEAFDYLTKEDLINKIKEINPQYQIFYIPGGDDGEYPENIMVAMLER